MEVVSGSNNWKIVFRRENGGITLLQAVTCDKKAALPRELFGLPVTALAHHALAPNRTPPAGEQVQITCGPVAGEWSNAGLEELHLPDTLTRADDYAFYNCGKLKTLYLSDSLCRWGGGALMNCRALDTFHLTCRGQQVNDGCFAHIDEVPKVALTLTVPTLFAGDYLFCVVPAPTKANAVREVMTTDKVDEHCPATVMRKHPNVIMYCDRDSGKYLL